MNFEQNFSNLVDLLYYRAEYQSNKLAFKFSNQSNQYTGLTYKQLHSKTSAVAVQLIDICQPGDRILILLPDAKTFLPAFFGCLYSGMIAVSIPIPTRINGASAEKLLLVTKDADIKAIVTTSLGAKILAKISELSELPRLIFTDDTGSTSSLINVSIFDESLASRWQRRKVTEDSIAFLQYTSGSTGQPKGVIVGHDNIWNNSEVIYQKFGHTPESKVVSWLPHFHDMGLVGGLLQPIFGGISCLLMKPSEFIKSPYNWLKNISDFRGTSSGSPNFAFDLCCEKISDEQLTQLDLSSWKVAFNGAESVSKDTIVKFGKKFAPAGFKIEAFYPCYGMAEATLFITGSDTDNTLPFKSLDLDRQALQQGSIVAVDSTYDNGKSLVSIVSCGSTDKAHEVQIVNPETRTLCDKNEIGEIWVKGPSIAKGYWKNKKLTQEIFSANLNGQGNYLRTGDLGFLREGELYITGRAKELIIIRGKNYFPIDIERTIESSHLGFKPNSGAAFSVKRDGEEVLIAVYEINKGFANLGYEMFGAAQYALNQQHQIKLQELVFLKKIPKTTSGKTQRIKCRQLYLKNNLSVIFRLRSEKCPISNNTNNLSLNSFNGLTARHSEKWLLQKLSIVLKRPLNAEHLDVEFGILGLDSMQALSIAGELEQSLGISVSPTLIYEYPTIRKLTHQLVGGQSTQSLTNREKLLEQSDSNVEPIAIVGIGCRFPEADNRFEYWQNLVDERDCISVVPADRWSLDDLKSLGNSESNNSSVAWGGFINDHDLFDPSFFSISPKEVKHIDPQQRLLLEVTQQALEDSGENPESLYGSHTGVFVGISTNDYSRLDGSLTPYTATGNAFSIAANRISYCFDWRGPSLAIDTACSSSLVAVHQAVSSLQRGEVDMALAGGCNLILTPHLYIVFSKAGMLSSDGRCKTFDHSANGYVRGEGCGVVILKRLSDAQRDGNHIYATLVGSAINQDGRSHGIAAPNGLAQEEVIRSALSNANCSKNSIDYIEAHGTGTSLGDLIEYEALENVFEDRSKNNPVFLGAVKTNIGHLEAAAGIASLIKVALALHHGKIPASLHLNRLSAQIKSKQKHFNIARKTKDWSKEGELRYAGVSSFGFGGTNVHMIVSQSPVLKSNDEPILSLPPVHLMCISAHKAQAFEKTLIDYQQALSQLPPAQIVDFTFSANTGRKHQKFRRAYIARGSEEFQELIAQNKDPVQISSSKKDVVFLFTGQGTQYWQMGIFLYESNLVFREVFNECDALIQQLAGYSLKEWLYEQPEIGEVALTKTDFTQLALFSVGCSLAKTYQSLGINPTAVMGHSIGEYIAACIAGVMNLDLAISVVLKRGELMAQLPPNGAMAVVFAKAEEITPYLSSYESRVVIAAFNHDRMLTLSGDKESLDKLLVLLSEQKISYRRVNVSTGFHSYLVDPILPEFDEYLKLHGQFQLPKVEIISNVTALPLNHKECKSNYWTRHMRQPVLFSQGLDYLYKAGYKIFLDLSPDGSLSRFANAQLSEDCQIITSMGRKRGWEKFVTSVARFYELGFTFDLKNWYLGFNPKRIPVPFSAYVKQRYWLEDKSTLSIQTTNMLENDSLNLGVAATVNSKVKKIVADLLEVDVEAVEEDKPFLEMGADSLVLIDAINAIQDNFNVKIPVRGLFDDLDTLRAVVNYIVDRQKVLESTKVHQTEPVLTTSEQTISTSPTASFPLAQKKETNMQTGVEALVQQQLNIMSQQLALLQGTQVVEGTVSNVQVDHHTVSSSQQVAQVANNANLKTSSTGAHSLWLKRDISKKKESLRKEKHLNKLIAKYTNITQKSKTWTQLHRAILADNRASAGFRLSTKEMLYPIVGTRSSGAYIWDKDGNRYVDFTMGFGTNLFGHNPNFIQHQLKEQVEKGFQIGPQTELAGDVAFLVAELTSHERVAFCNSGSEAVMTAVRLARAVTGKNKIVIFSGSYHGVFDGVLGRRNTVGTASETVPLAAGTTHNFVANLLVLDYGDPKSLELIVNNLDDLAAVLVEPVQSRHPELQPKEFLLKLREITINTNIALIFDEVITGFRIGSGGAQKFFGVKADLATYGKIAGGGLPIGLVAGCKRFMDPIDGGIWQYGDDSYPQAEPIFFAGTFSKHPLTMATAKATLQKIKTEQSTIYPELERKSAWLADELNKFFSEENIPIIIVRFGSLFRFKYSGNYDILFYHLMLQGIFIWEGRNCFISTTHSEADIRAFIEATKASILAMKADDFFSDKNSFDWYPLSESQKRFVKLSQFHEGGKQAGNIGLIVRFHKPFNLENLKCSLEVVISHYECLNNIVDIDNFSQRKSYRKLNDFIEIVEVEAYSLDEFLNKQVQQEFDFINGPLFKAILIKIEQSVGYLLLMAHHLVSDGWSFVTLVREIMSHYQASQNNRTSPILSPALSYRDYVAQESATLSIQALEYWVNEYVTNPPEILFENDTGLISNLEGFRLSRVIKIESVAERLSDLAKSYKCTDFILLLSLFQKCIYDISKRERFTIAVPILNFPRSSRQQTPFGCCVNLLPIICECKNLNQDFKEVTKSLQRKFFEGVEHRNFSYNDWLELIVDKLNRKPIEIVQASFNLEPTASLSGLENEVSLISLPIKYVELPLMVNILQMNDELNIEIDYQSAYFTLDRAAQILNEFTLMIEEIFNY